MRTEGKSFADISEVLNITRHSARHLCNYKPKMIKKKRGPKVKITGFRSYRVHREIQNIKKYVEKVTTTKIIRNCNLDVSKPTCWRAINRFGYKCVNAKVQILLSKKHKEERVKCITDWLTENHDWNETVFSDEKRFSLDSPDSWYTYVKIGETNIRQIRHIEGGGIFG